MKIFNRICLQLDLGEMTSEPRQLNKLVVSKRKLASQIDALDVTDKHYDKKYQDSCVDIITYLQE